MKRERACRSMKGERKTEGAGGGNWKTFIFPMPKRVGGKEKLIGRTNRIRLFRQRINIRSVW